MEHRYGMVALVGKPHVGKSTLLNHMVGQKVAITSNKKQTTRRRLLGIVTRPEFQVAFVDTPGIHEPHTRLGKAMVESARGSLADLDLVVYVVNASQKPDEDERRIARTIRESGYGGSSGKLILCMNKMDLLKAEFVVQHVEAYRDLLGVGDEDYMLTTATKGDNVEKLLSMLVARLPEGPPAWDEDALTDQSSRFMAAEFVREKVMQRTKQEVPYATGVLVDDWIEEPGGRVKINATIVVERVGQRAILIGKKGAMLKTIGTEARLDIERLLERPVYLELFVKVREDWRQNPTALREMEYME
ncbi:MAG: GTPase Era [Nitrospirae bacterium]|nr:GTPase Era [Fimbriimonadaceae bacterium]